MQDKDGSACQSIIELQRGNFDGGDSWFNGGEFGWRRLAKLELIAFLYRDRRSPVDGESVTGLTNTESPAKQPSGKPSM